MQARSYSQTRASAWWTPSPWRTRPAPRRQPSAGSTLGSTVRGTSCKFGPFDWSKCLINSVRGGLRLLQPAGLQAGQHGWPPEWDEHCRQILADQGHAVQLQLQQPGPRGVRPVLLWAESTGGQAFLRIYSNATYSTFFFLCQIQTYNFDNANGRHLANQDQQVCVRCEKRFPAEFYLMASVLFDNRCFHRRERGNCRICWSAIDNFDFGLTGRFVTKTVLGLISGSVSVKTKLIFCTKMDRNDRGTKHQQRERRHLKHLLTHCTYWCLCWTPIVRK